MTKKNSTGGSANSVRKELERLDRDLVKVLSDRARAVQKLAKIHHENGQPIFDLLQEQEALERVADANKGPLSPEALNTIYRDVQGTARALVKPLRIGYLGPKYSYSHIAAIQKFGYSPDLTPLSTIKVVFESLHFGQIDYGVVPLENSTDGRVVDTLDMFARLPTQITGEVQVRIHHCLLGKCARSEVVEVYSKPQALSQCRDWLAKNLPGAKMIEMTSTAIAAQIAADKPGAAAVASIEAGLHYGLNALMFELAHKPGALADSMLVFKRGRLNLTWIESFPMAGSPSEYLFFVEFEGHRDDSRAKRALQTLARKTARLEVLGSYARAVPVESVTRTGSSA
jgi:chorismate mutase/prephenate dehydratase